MNKLRAVVMGKDAAELQKANSVEEYKLDFSFDSEKLLNITYHYEHLKEVLEYLMKTLQSQG